MDKLDKLPDHVLSILLSHGAKRIAVFGSLDVIGNKIYEPLSQASLVMNMAQVVQDGHYFDESSEQSG